MWLKFKRIRRTYKKGTNISGQIYTHFYQIKKGGDINLMWWLAVGLL